MILYQWWFAKGVHNSFQAWPFSVSFYKGISCQIWPFWSILGNLCWSFLGVHPRFDFKHSWKIAFFSTRIRNKSLKSEDCRPGGWPGVFQNGWFPGSVWLYELFNPYHPRMVYLLYLPAFGWFLWRMNVREYTSPMDHVRVIDFHFGVIFCDWSQLHPTCKDFFEKIGHLVPLAKGKHLGRLIEFNSLLKDVHPPGNQHIPRLKALLSRWFSEPHKVGCVILAWNPYCCHLQEVSRQQRQREVFKKAQFESPTKQQDDVCV